MTRYCLDTSAYSHFKRGHPVVVELLDSAEWVGVPAVTIGELWTGFLQGARVTANEAELAEFLANPAVELLPIDDHVARIYGEIVVELRRKGTPLPTNDIWIAATAARAGATVLTYDPHFTQIGRVGSVVLEFDVPGSDPPG
jgi:predicted nucleic acid-binding protein